ncbi:Cytoplasmic dynein 1 light intermediate chain [Lachnellula subtilissima]|uniref:Cytoplasmic dynein 1 light intermediate chain n=1 Tax=Lachnellula subtilissima TaxID=602034 RepID=A0A8H8S2P0_9HELO|nr:Cytoplasmic dynein 1 light intermediate chain [Lachnellula subtilissima]
MASSNNRTSTNTQVSTSSDHDRPKSADAKKDIWSSMLDSVASGKRLPEKNLLVLGKRFYGLPAGVSRNAFVRRYKKDLRQAGQQAAYHCKQLALGYTYHDVLDADHEDILARLSLYLLADPSPSFAPLLQPLLTPETIPNTLVVILLDWSQPWFWLRQLRDWVQLLRTLLVSLDNTCKDKMEEVMLSWRDRGRGGNSLDGVGASSTSEGDVSLPLGPGEWQEPLGLPVCVVCQNSDRIENLEKERSWREEEFDFILQLLRTILLKHGASLIYTIPSVTSPLQSLIHSSLGIHSLLKRQPLKHNVIDRDKVVVPPNWDSWGKIRVLRDGFDVEAISNGWSVDIEESFELIPNGNTNGEATRIETSKRSGGAVEAYEETIRDPRLDALQATSKENEGLIPEITSSDTQTFLATQLAVLDKIRQGTDSSGMDSSRLIAGRNATGSGYETGEEGHADEGRVNEHIGPVQFNMGGIQVDADDMLQRLKDRQSYQTPEPTSPGSIVPGDAKTQNEALQSFFAGLMKRGGGSASSSPKP